MTEERITALSGVATVVILVGVVVVIFIWDGIKWSPIAAGLVAALRRLVIRSNYKYFK